ncbi:MAG TPA: (Fe-S)-binding protein, partial [Thermoleophilia bacterium]|nr:(Fe-S)-binding protein [Thermoleophilia bacterium]
TPCATCFYTFKRLYPAALSGLGLGADYGIEVLHTAQVVDSLLKEGNLQLTTPIPMKVTYHDPCHLGRQGEDYVPWHGKEIKIYGQAVVYEPRRPRYNGAFGVYEPPRDVINAIPGVELIEMERTKEASWCCGAGAALPQAYPEFSAWTASKRIDEAKSTGADAVLTACGGCVKNLGGAVAADGGKMEVIDMLELVERAL